MTIYLLGGDIDINMYNAHFNLITIWPSKCYLNERVSFQLNNVRGVRKKTRQSEERELQILTKYVLSFIIISPSTLSRLQHLRKIDDTRCCPLFHTFRVLGSVSNMDLLYLSAIHLACVCHYLDIPGISCMLFYSLCCGTSGIWTFNLYDKGCVSRAAIHLTNNKYSEGRVSNYYTAVLVD